MDDDDVDDLWGPPLVVKEDTFRSKPLRGCEFWFDFRTDVLEESYQIERYCELVWTILNEKKIDELGKDLSSSPDTTLSATLPDDDTSSDKSSLDEDENTSSISDAQTMQNKDPTNDTEDVDPETNLKKPQETAADDAITVEVAEDGDTPCSPVLALESMIEEAEEHSCSSLVTQQVSDPIKQVTENKFPSAISQEINGEGSSLTPLAETKEKANATSEDGEKVLKDQQQKQRDSLQEIETASEPFTTESLLEMCDEPEQDREAPSKRSVPEAWKIIVKEEPIINMLTEARIKVESKALLNPPGSVLTKKRKITTSNSTSLIRNTKKKVGGETPTESKPKIITKSPSVPPLLSASTLDLIDRIRQRRGVLLSELKDKTGKELRSIAKELKVTHYYKMKKEDLLQNCIMQLRLQLTGCKE
ncbi:Rho_N domain-containing protein [Hirschfeldia incana]|nr:Rho_N domain-containing protein [Hirschfeldia incana]